MDENVEHHIIETFPASQKIGYVILRGLCENHRSIELKRIVITEKNRGYGRETLRLVKKLCFEEWRAHRLWLDFKEHNTRAHHLYESKNFMQEGVLRECIKNGETYESLIVMFMLEQEYYIQPGGHSGE
jgi:RimJ/RimL family protein N-acetyltransferase